MAAEILTAGTVVKAFAPVLNDIYNSSKSALNKRIESWKLGNDLERFEKYYSRLSMIKTIWARDEAVSIDSFYYPSRLQQGTKHSNVINDVDDLGADNVIVEGIVGQGKSVFMRHLAMAELKKADSKVIPLFVELRYVSEKTSLRQLLINTLVGLGASSDPVVLEYLLAKKQLMLFLDGYDEIEPELVKETTQEIINIQVNHSGLRIVISSRPSNDIQNVAGFKVKSLASLKPKDHLPFLKKLGVETNRILEIIEAIKNSPVEIRESISTPLMLSIVVLVYKSANQIPLYLAEFFSVLFHVVFTQHDGRKDSFRRHHNSGLSESELQEVFEAFCFSVTKNRYGRTLTALQFNECFQNAQVLTQQSNVTACKFKDDIAGVACLLLEEGIGELTFLHKGILDFFTASFVSKLKKPASAEKFYSTAARGFNAWRGALQFLSKIDSYRFNKFYFLKFVYEDWLECQQATEQSDPEKFIKYTDELFEETRIEKRESGMMTHFKPKERTEFSLACVRAMSTGCNRPIMLDNTLEGMKNKFIDAPGVHFELLENGDIGFSLKSAQLVIGCESMMREVKVVVDKYEESFSKARQEVAAAEERERMIEMNLD
ncbi:NACHT domain-containing protein [Pseudomonas sp. H3_C08]